MNSAHDNSDDDDDEIQPFKIPTRCSKGIHGHGIKYCHITSRTTVGDLKKFLRTEFKAADICNVVWGK
jgi:hypothetical protein